MEWNGKPFINEHGRLEIDHFEYCSEKGTGYGVLLKDFPENFKKIRRGNKDRYQFTNICFIGFLPNWTEDEYVNCDFRKAKTGRTELMYCKFTDCILTEELLSRHIFDSKIIIAGMEW